MIRESGANQAGERPHFEYLESCLRHKAEMVILEAARTITELSGVSSRELTPAITGLQLCWKRPCNRDEGKNRQKEGSSLK